MALIRIMETEDEYSLHVFGLCLLRRKSIKPQTARPVGFVEYPSCAPGEYEEDEDWEEDEDNKT